MRKIGKIAFIALELLSYVALFIGLLAAFYQLIFSNSITCSKLLDLDNSCGSDAYVRFDDLFFMIVMLYINLIAPILFALLGILLGLRRIHHIKTHKLRAQGRFDEVVKLRYFLLKSFGYIIIPAILMGVLIATLSH